MDFLRLEIVKIGFLGISLIDVFDILLVAFIFYTLYKTMRGTRGAQMFAGLGVILIASFIAQSLNMSGMTWLIKNVQTVWVIAFVILFQPEIRRLLIIAGQSRIVRAFVNIEQTQYVEPMVKSAVECSQRRYGALMIMMRDTGLKSILESGIPIQARVSETLIVSLFSPRSLLHDGALIINQDTILAGKCLLPLSQSPNLNKRLGTRHRAGVGITEESDAVAIIVSEETGNISVAENGKLIEDLDYDSLYSYLLSAFKEQLER